MRAILILTLFWLSPAPALAKSETACGVPEVECPTANGFYRLAMPEGAAGPVPALVFLHGGSSTAASVTGNTAMLAELSARGYALIAPEGQARPSRPNKNWGVNDNRVHPRDDIAFVAEVLDDAAQRGIDRNRILLAGFSRGASMVWDIACRTPAAARAYAPVSGAFWEPLPEECDSPVKLFHSHGWTDRVVPIEGRSFRGGTVVQGDVFAGLTVLRRTNGCSLRQPDSAPMEAAAGLWFRSWSECAGGRLDLMLHPGGHQVPEGWLARALDWFEVRLADD
jgi:polyhydroxybutyrate depolymerase